LQKTSSCAVVVRVPAAQRCPYPTFGTELSRAQRRAAAHDRRCDMRWHSNDRNDLAAARVRVDDGTNLATLTGASGADAAAAAAVLRAGGVVVPDARFVEGGQVTVVAQVSDSDDQAQERRVPGYTLSNLDVMIVSPQVISDLGMGTRIGSVVAATTRAPTPAEQDRARAQLVALGPKHDDLQVENGPDRSLDTVALILALAAGVLALGVTAAATGLAAADGRADISTLAAVGAAPWTRRLLSLSQSGVIAGLGSLLGALAGLGAGLAVLVALNQPVPDQWPASDPYPLVVPWLNLVIGLLAIPAVAMLSAGLLTRSRLPVERRQPT